MLDLELSQVIIQIIGFLGMLWILKRYGWKPLLDTLDLRKKKIEAEFDSIENQKTNANQLILKYEEKLKEIEIEMRKKIQEAVEQGRQISNEIQETAQTKAKEILQNTRNEMEREIGQAKNQLKTDMVNLVISITHKILKENLDESNQKKLIQNFVEEATLK